jgi:hypothetical protein
MHEMKEDDKLDDSPLDPLIIYRRSKRYVSSSWDMFLRRGESGMKARLAWRIGKVALYSGIVLEVTDHIGLSMPIIADTANALVGIGGGSLMIGGMLAVGDMVSEQRKQNNQPLDPEQ